MKKTNFVPATAGAFSGNGAVCNAAQVTNMRQHSMVDLIFKFLNFKSLNGFMGFRGVTSGVANFFLPSPAERGRGRGLNFLKTFVMAIAIFAASTSGFAQTVTLNDGDVVTSDILATSFGGSSITINVTGGTATITGNINGYHVMYGIIWHTFTKTGPGKLIMLGQVLNISGNCVINDGILQLGNGDYSNISNFNCPVVVNEGKELRFVPSAHVTFPKLISGAGNVSYLGGEGKSLLLSANNTYAGTTTVEGWNLHVGAGGTTGAISNSLVLNNGQVVFDRTDTYQEYHGVISGNGSVVKWHETGFVLTGESTFTGYVSVTGGVLALSATGTMENAGVLLYNASQLHLYGHKKIGYLASDNAAARVGLGEFNLTIGTAGQDEGERHYHGTIDGTGAVIKQGLGHLSLIGNNTHTGGTYIEEGWIWTGHTVPSGGNVTQNYVNNSNLVFVCADNYTYSGVMTGAGNFHLLGGGTLTLNNANSYWGTSIVHGTNLVLGTMGSIESTWLLTFGETGGALHIGSGNKKIRNLFSTNSFAVVELGASILTIGNEGHEDGAGLYYGTINGTGGITKFGTGGLGLYGHNNYTGTTTINEGAIVVGTYGYFVCNNVINNGIFAFNYYHDVVYNGLISGSGIVDKYDGNTLTLTNANTYWGATQIFHGTLVLSETGSIENSYVAFGNEGGVFDISSGNKKLRGLTGASGEVKLGASTLTIGNAGEDNGGGIYSGIITGNGGIIKKGLQDLFLCGNNTYTGLTTIEEGRLLIGYGGETGEILGNIQNNSHLFFNREGDYTYSGAISGTGDLSKGWYGKLTLDGANTYTGYTYIVDGTLALGANGSIENSYIVNFASGLQGKFDVSAGNKKIKSLGQGDYDTSNTEVILGESTLTVGTAGLEDGNGVYHGKISGTGGITKYGNSHLVLANNAFTGLTTVEEGRLVLTGGHLSNIVLNTEDCVAFVSSTPQTYSGAISGRGFIAKQSSGTLTLNGANTFTGSCHFYDGKIVLGTNGSIENASYVHLINENSKLDITSGNKKINGLVGCADAEVILGTRTLTLTLGDFAGVFSGTGGGITKTGAGQFNMSGENTATGTFALNEGTLNFANKWSGGLTQSANTNLIVNETAIVGGSLLLLGGEITMDLTTQYPSRIICSSAASVPALTTLNITSGEVTNHSLILANSGLNNADMFRANMLSGQIPQLTATGTELLLTVYTNIDKLQITNYKLQVYPNPTTGQLRITGIRHCGLDPQSPANNDEIAEMLNLIQYRNDNQGVQVYNAAGRVVFTSSLSLLSPETALDITHLPNGVYFVKVGNETVKVVKR